METVSFQGFVKAVEVWCYRKKLGENVFSELTRALLLPGSRVRNQTSTILSSSLLKKAWSKFTASLWAYLESKMINKYWLCWFVWNIRLDFRIYSPQPFKCQTYQMVKHTNCLSILDHFVALALKGLTATFQSFYPKDKGIWFPINLLKEKCLSVHWCTANI